MSKRDLISQINITDIDEAECIIKGAGSEELFKAKPGDEREYQGRMYVYGTTKSGKMGWRVKDKIKRGGGNSTITTTRENSNSQKTSNTVTHDINGTKVTVTKNSDGSYTLEANGKKVKSDDPSFFVFGTNIKPKVKNALAKELGLDTTQKQKKIRPIGTGTNGPEKRKK